MGTMNTDSSVPMSMPQNTVVPMARWLAELAPLAKYSGTTPKMKANEVIKRMIAEILGEAEEPVGMAMLIADPRLPDGMSTQKLGALLGQMVKDGTVEKGKADKHVVYSLVAEE